MSRRNRGGGRPNAGPSTRSARRERSPRADFRFRGQIMRVRADENLVVLRVLGGNARARRHLGRDLLLALGAARLVAADRNGDGRLTIADLRERELALACVRVESDVEPSAPLPVRRLELEALPPMPTSPNRRSSG
jgi:hypothetical protein